MEIQYLGHSCFSINIDDLALIVDPFISSNPLATQIALDELRADYILITHAHQDHLADVDRIAKNNRDLKIISNYEIVSWFDKQDIRGIPMNTGGQIRLDALTIKYVSAIHSSSFPDGSYGGNPGGFVLWSDSFCVYIAGDTCLSYDMQLIPKLCPPLDLAILPIGDHFTMGYEEACEAAEFVNCRTIIPCHYDTFDLVKVDKMKVRDHFRKAGKEIHFLDIGSKYNIR